jgi:hypothetical protein
LPGACHPQSRHHRSRLQRLVDQQLLQNHQTNSCMRESIKFAAFPFLKSIGPCNRCFPSSRFFLTMLLIKADELVQYSSLCFIGSFLLRS